MKTETKAKSVVVYALRCPDSGFVRYIGKANDPEARLKTHLREAGKRNRPVCNWIAGLMMAGKLPEMTVQASCIGDWRMVEQQMICQYREESDLLNLADGGDHIPVSATQRSARAADLIRSMGSEDALLVRDFLRDMAATAKEAASFWPQEKLARFQGNLLRAKAAAKKNPCLIASVLKRREHEKNKTSISAGSV